MDYNDFMDLVASRRSCRSFSPRRPAKEELLAVMEAARLAPSACNNQPWRYIAVNSEELSPKIARATQDLGMNRFASKAPAFIVCIQQDGGALAKAGERAQGGQAFAPIDLGLSVMQLCLAAEARGLNTCILGWLNAKKLRPLLSLPDSANIRLVIAIGYTDEGYKRPAKKRKPLDEAATYIGDEA